jgi:hypothetical protein
LDVSATTGVLAERGEEATAETSGNAPLKFQQAFEIRSGGTTHLIADFAPFRRGDRERDGRRRPERRRELRGPCGPPRFCRRQPT